ncbi:TPA: hypothetical protein ACKRTE_002391 [Providencia rettgeri]
MSAAITSPTTPSSITEIFEVKATQPIEKWKASHSDIKMLRVSSGNKK